MHSISEYIEGLSKKLIFKAVLIFVVTTTVAGVLLYMASLQVPLTGAYGRAIATISLYKLQVIRDGFYIYMLYAAFVMMGVVIISWFYSRRVARPFQKIQGYAREMAKGNFDVKVAFEDNSDVHPLADAINKMARDCKIRNEHLHQRIEALASEVHHLEGAFNSGDKEEFERVYRSLSARAEEIEEAFSELKL
jgi:methyl-accepting chemotaxis protein